MANLHSRGLGKPAFSRRGRLLFRSHSACGHESPVERPVSEEGRFEVPLTALFFTLLWVSTTATVAAPGQDPAGASTLEYQVKAAFIYNFAKFVDWPPESFPAPDAPLAICVLEGNTARTALEAAVAHKIVSGRKLVVRRVDSGDPLEHCHVLFVGSEQKALTPILERARRWPVLTVGETSGFADYGGIINFFKDQNRIRFQINLEAAEQARLRISSKLLSLATPIRKDARREEP